MKSIKELSGGQEKKKIKDLSRSQKVPWRASCSLLWVPVSLGTLFVSLNISSSQTEKLDNA